MLLLPGQFALAIRRLVRKIVFIPLGAYHIIPKASATFFF